jgi:NAD(P)H dehydrogenase (quinone)
LSLGLRPEDIPVVDQQGAQDAVVGDMRDAVAFRQAAQGTAAIYHICPNISPDEAAITAAQAAEVNRFVCNSVRQPQIEAMLHHWLKLWVEERLPESRLPFTILRPAAYMQNVLAQWERITTQGIYPVPFPVETRLGMVDLVDVHWGIVHVLDHTALHLGHMQLTYQLWMGGRAGTSPLWFDRLPKN